MNRSAFGLKLSQRRLGPPSTIQSLPSLPRRMPLRRTTVEAAAGGSYLEYVRRRGVGPFSEKKGPPGFAAALNPGAY